MVDVLEFARLAHSDLTVEPPVVEPIDVLPDRDLEIVDAWATDQPGIGDQP